MDSEECFKRGAVLVWPRVEAELSAAVSIQSHFRGHRKRRHTAASRASDLQLAMAAQAQASKKIQARCRSKEARKSVAQAKRKQREDEIQAAHRKARKAVRAVGAAARPLPPRAGGLTAAEQQAKVLDEELAALAALEEEQQAIRNIQAIARGKAARREHAQRFIRGHHKAPAPKHPKKAADHNQNKADVPSPSPPGRDQFSTFGWQKRAAAESVHKTPAAAHNQDHNHDCETSFDSEDEAAALAGGEEGEGEEEEEDPALPWWSSMKARYDVREATESAANQLELKAGVMKVQARFRGNLTRAVRKDELQKARARGRMSVEQRRREKVRLKMEEENAERDAVDRAERETREAEARAREDLLRMLDECGLGEYGKSMMAAGMTLARLRRMDPATVAAQLGRSPSGMSLGPCGTPTTWTIPQKDGPNHLE